MTVPWTRKRSGAVIARMTEEKATWSVAPSPSLGARVGGGKAKDDGATSAIDAQQAAPAPALRDSPRSATASRPTLNEEG